MMRKVRYLAVGAGLTLLLVGGVLLVKTSQPSANALNSPASGMDSGWLKDKGPEDAPVQIIKYTNFQCPACAKSEEVLDAFMKTYPGKIHLIFRHFPLAGHGWGHLTHQAAECANQQHQFWPYHDKLFSQQQQIMLAKDPIPILLEDAQLLNLNLDDFSACLTNGEITRRILQEKQSGTALEVKATPTFFVNGTRYVGWLTLKNDGEKQIRRILHLPEQVSENAENPSVKEGQS